MSYRIIHSTIKTSTRKSQWTKEVRFFFIPLQLSDEHEETFVAFMGASWFHSFCCCCCWPNIDHLRLRNLLVYLWYANTVLSATTILICSLTKQLDLFYFVALVTTRVCLFYAYSKFACNIQMTSREVLRKTRS